MSGKWGWATAQWNTLPETLTELEAQGEEIFTICPMGASQSCLVVYHKAIWPPYEKDEADAVSVETPS